MIALSLVACTVHTPFVGPGIDGNDVTTDHPGPFVFAVTYARTAPGNSGRFGDLVERIQDQLERSDGVVAWSLRADLPGRDNWTFSVWESEEAMWDFVTSETHVVAVDEAGELLEDSAFTAWLEPDASSLPPRWQDGLDRLEP
jgi:quinol monooxygenase YgiN